MPPALRLATALDAQQVQEIYAPYCFTPISFELEPPSVAEIRQRIEKILPLYPWIVLEDGGTMLGYAYAGRHRDRAAYAWSVDTSVYIREDSRRRGIGRALYTSLLAMLPLQGYVFAYAGITLPNPGSVGLHEAMGFVRVGIYDRVGFKCGAWHDVMWLQRPLQACPAEPPPTKTLAEVQKLPGWEPALRAGLPRPTAWVATNQDHKP
jgi:phosphinothricin acetyltransferase